MATRLQLHNKLVELFGSSHVYYQPPENLKMEYPCIRYSKNDIDTLRADNKAYRFMNQYQIIVIDKHPDNDVINKILSLPTAEYNRHYISDGLNHDVIILYY